MEEGGGGGGGGGGILKVVQDRGIGEYQEGLIPFNVKCCNF